MFSAPYRPILQLRKTKKEWLFDWIGMSIFISSLLYTVLKWSYLPEQMPMHVNSAGEVDRYGSKWELFLLPSIGLVVWGMMHWLEKKPHVHNYPARLNEHNVEAFYLNSRLMLNMTKNSCLLLFAFIQIQMIRISSVEAATFGKAFIPILLVIIFVPMGIGIYKQTKIR